MASATHQPDLTQVYGRAAAPLTLGLSDFRLTAIRALGSLDVGGMTTSVNWRYDPGDAILHGNLVMVRPDRLIQPVNLVDGNELRLETRWYDTWREVWRMRLSNSQVDPVSGNWTFDLNDDLVVLQESSDDFHFIQSKKHGHPNGWFVHDIVREVARRYRIPLGTIASGKHRIKNLSMKGVSPLAVIARAYALERAESGRRFVIAWQNGKLDVTPLSRNEILYVLREQIESAPITREPRDAKFATAVTVRATVGRGKAKKRKIAVLVSDDRAIAREGFVHRTLRTGNFTTEEEAIKYGKRYIAKHGLRKRTCTIDHPGIPFIRRGDAIQIDMPEEGFKGTNGTAFLTSGSWNLSGGAFDMSLTFGFDDPFFTAQQERDAKSAAARKKKAAKHDN